LTSYRHFGFLVSNISVWIDTSGLTGFKSKAQVRYLWPRISSSRVVIFPLTALGNHSVMEILLHNPSELPILIQAVLAKDYGPAWFQFTYANNVGGNTTEGELGNLPTNLLLFIYYVACVFHIFMCRFFQFLTWTECSQVHLVNQMEV